METSVMIRTRWGVALAMVIGACGRPAAAAAPGSAPNGGWDARWAPDGSAVAFLSQRVGDPPNLWTMDPRGGNMRQLSTGGVRLFRWASDSGSLIAQTWLGGKLVWCRIIRRTGAVVKAWSWLPSDAAEPTPSPNGAWVAYLSRVGQWADVWVARANGEQRAKVTSHVFAQKLLWAPNSRHFAFEAANPHVGWQTQVWVYDREKRTTAHMSGLGTTLHSWSSDSRQLAFSLAMPPNGFLLGLCDVSTGKAEPVKKVNHTGEGVQWTPDGRSLVLTVRDGASSQICIVLPTGTVVRRIGDARLMARFAQISPDGRRIVFEGQEKGKSYGSEIWTADLGGDAVERLTPSYPADWAPTPSPDGSRVAFLTTRGRKAEVWTADSAGARSRRLADADAAAVLAWSPDGSTLLVLQPGGSALYPFSAKAAARPLPIRPTVPYASWSPDGKRFIYTGFEQRRAALLVYDTVANTSRPLLKGTNPKMAPDTLGAWAPGGGTVAFVRGRDLWVAGPDGRGARKLATIGAKDDIEFGALRWSPKGDRILLSCMRESRSGARWELHGVALTGKDTCLINEPTRSEFAARRAAYSSQPAWTAGGDVVFASDRAGKAQAWLLAAGQSAPRALTAGFAAYPVQTRDGGLLFAAPEGRRTTIWLAAPGASKPALWLRAH